MSDVYDAMQIKATLEYRLGFARRVLRCELLTTRLLGHERADRLLRVGTPEPGTYPPVYYYSYRDVSKNVEGRSTQANTDMFADLSSDSDEDY